MIISKLNLRPIVKNIEQLTFASLFFVENLLQ